MEGLTKLQGCFGIKTALPLTLRKSDDSKLCPFIGLSFRVNRPEAPRMRERQSPQQMAAERLRHAVSASDQAITRYGDQLNTTATGMSRLARCLEMIELRLRRVRKG